MPPSNQFPAPYSPPPQQQPQQPQQPGQTPYDFFMEQDANRRNPFSGGGGDGSKKLLFIGLAGAFVVFVLIAIFFLVFGGKDAPSPLTSVATSQQEIIRVAAHGSKNSKSTPLQNFSATAELAVTSAQVETIKLASKNGTKIDPKELGKLANTKTDQALASALAVNTYDTTYTSIMTEELDKYEAQLQNAYSLAKSEADRKLLKKHADGAALLEKQLNAR